MSANSAEKKTAVPARSHEVFSSILARLNFCTEALEKCYKKGLPTACHEESLQCVNGLTKPKSGMKG